MLAKYLFKFFLVFYSCSVVSEEQADIEIDALFELSLNELLNIKVKVATGIEQEVREAPAIVSVVTANTIRQFGYTSVAQAINALPGIYCIEDGLSANCGVRGVNGGFRGYSKIFKVMINGQPISFRSDSNNYLGPELLPIKLVERIELVRGPASALYGANAFLGVVNIIAKKATDKTGHLNLTEGSDGQSFAVQLFSNNPNNSFTLGVSSAQLDRSGRKVPDTVPQNSKFISGSESKHDTSQPFNMFAQASWQVHRHYLESDVYFSRMDSKAQFVDFGRFAESGELGTDVGFALDTGFIRAQDNWKVNDEFSTKLSLAYAKGQPGETENLDLGLTNTISKRDFGFEAINLVSESMWQVTQYHAVTAGVDYSVDNEDLFEGFDIDRQTGVATLKGVAQGHRDFINTGVYLQYSGYPFNDFAVTLNARMDEHNIYGKDTNYRTGLVYSFNKDISTKLLFGTSYKAPAALQLYGQPLFSGEVAGNPDLEVETAVTTEAQLNYQIEANLFWSINIYQMKVEDKVELLLVRSNQTPQNIDEQTTTGVESQVQWQNDKNQINANVSILESEIKNTIQDVTGDAALYPKNVANVFWRYKLNSTTGIGTHWRYVSNRLASNSNITLNGGKPYEVDAYQVFSVSINHDLKPFQIDFKIENLLDEVYADPGFAGVDVPGQTRKVIFSLGLEL